MAVNRFDELMAGAVRTQEIEIDMGSMPTKGHVYTHVSGGADHAHIFEEIEEIKRLFAAITSATEAIVTINGELPLVSTTAREQELSVSLAQVVADGNKSAKKAHNALQSLNQEIKDKSELDAEIRLRKNALQTLTRKYVIVLKDYQHAQARNNEIVKKRVAKRVRIVKPDATAEEIDDAIASGVGGELIQRMIQEGSASDAVCNAFQKADSKYRDVILLEASVRELASMMSDFGLIVEQQGELLDSVEHNVKMTIDYVDDGNENIRKATEELKSYLCKKACVIATVLVIIGVIILLIVLKFESVL